MTKNISVERTLYSYYDRLKQFISQTNSNSELVMSTVAMLIIKTRYRFCKSHRIPKTNLASSYGLIHNNEVPYISRVDCPWGAYRGRYCPNIILVFLISLYWSYSKYPEILSISCRYFLAGWRGNKGHDRKFNTATLKNF